MLSELPILDLAVALGSNAKSERGGHRVRGLLDHLATFAIVRVGHFRPCET